MRRLARLRELARDLGVATVATGDVHAHHPRRAALQDALVAIRCRTSLDGCEPERRGNHESVLLPPDAMLDRFPDDRDAVLRTAELASGLTFDLTQELGYRYPDFSDGFETPDGQLRIVCEQAFSERYSRNGKRAAAARRGARTDLRAEALRVLPAPLGGARARARGRGRGAGARFAAARAAAGARARQLGRLDRLLPDRALARRPGRGEPLARPFPQPRARLGARHRPRLPARHPREADRPRDRALRPRSTLRWSLRSRPTTRAARSATSARRSACRSPSSSGSRGSPRGTPIASPRRWRSSPATTLRHAGERWASSRTRSADCRGTSRSTRAGW